ncbi:BON domain-containing protein [Acrocarpospora catenulata]|uniref:BON domain-containing protein n=1 Tax=Acrocarpospora catenulata TaxID=2836182 RepID=UPI001BDAD4F7|nr:CBS domain-containing protein [Acrocarpospora catenulata]
MPMEVRDVMGHVAIAVAQDAGFNEIVAAMRRFKVGAVTVIDLDRRPVGVVSEDDLLLKATEPPRHTLGALTPSRRAAQRKAAGVTAHHLMTAPAIVVTPGTPVREAARLMHRNRVKQLPVIDPVSGRVCGTLHQSDLLRVFARPAEELYADVTAAIREQAGLDPTRLTIDVGDGVVTVMGHANAAEARRIEEAVRQVDGVVDVAWEIEARPEANGRMVPPTY